jgi:hypothetical protein
VKADTSLRQIDEAADFRLEAAGKVVDFEQNAALERLMPTLDLSLGLAIERCFFDVPDVSARVEMAQPVG